MWPYRAFAALAIGGLGYFVTTVVALHFLPTGYNLVTQVVSDYGVGRYSFLMMVGFLAGGVPNRVRRKLISTPTSLFGVTVNAGSEAPAFGSGRPSPQNRGEANGFYLERGRCSCQI